MTVFDFLVIAFIGVVVYALLYVRSCINGTQNELKAYFLRLIACAVVSFVTVKILLM